jgi:hypothetical protein
VSSTTSTPPRATAAATANAAFIPLVKTLFVTCAMAVARCAGAPAGGADAMAAAFDAYADQLIPAVAGHWR